jgi:hypothetical protein
MSAFVDAMVTFLRDNIAAWRDSRRRPVPGEAKARLTLYPPRRDRVERTNKERPPGGSGMQSAGARIPRDSGGHP